MKVVLWILALVAALAALLAVYARLKPIDPVRFTAQPGPMEPGKHGLDGGVKWVIPLADLPEGSMGKLLEIIRNTPRTREVTSDHGYSFITRSRGFGFPDVTRVWIADDALHIHAHLVIGKSDLGVNGNRVGQWLRKFATTVR